MKPPGITRLMYLKTDPGGKFVESCAPDAKERDIAIFGVGFRPVRIVRS
jgi:hypothetical protein